MRVAGLIWRLAGIIFALAFAVLCAWPVSDDAGQWTTNPLVTGAIALFGVVAGVLVARSLPSRWLTALSRGAPVSIPIAFVAFFGVSYDWFTTDGGACVNGPCGSTPEVVSGVFAAYGLFVAAFVAMALPMAGQRSG